MIRQHLGLAEFAAKQKGNTVYSGNREQGRCIRVPVDKSFENIRERKSMQSTTRDCEEKTGEFDNTPGQSVAQFRRLVRIEFPTATKHIHHEEPRFNIKCQRTNPSARVMKPQGAIKTNIRISPNQC